MQSKITALCRQNFGELSPVSVANTLRDSAVNVYLGISGANSYLINIDKIQCVSICFQ